MMMSFFREKPRRISRMAIVIHLFWANTVKSPISRPTSPRAGGSGVPRGQNLFLRKTFYFFLQPLPLPQFLDLPPYSVPKWHFELPNERPGTHFCTGNNSDSGFFWAIKVEFTITSRLYITCHWFFVKNNWICYKIRETTELVVSEIVAASGVRSCISSPFSRCTPVLNWSE